MKTIAALPGQGIGVKVVDATCEIMAAAGHGSGQSSKSVKRADINVDGTGHLASN